MPGQTTTIPGYIRCTCTLPSLNPSLLPSFPPSLLPSFPPPLLPSSPVSSLFYHLPEQIAPVGDVKGTFHSLREEVLRAADGTTIQDRDTDAALSFIDKVICVSSSVSAPSVKINLRVSVPWQVTYLLSNAMAADAGTRFYLLGTVVCFCFVCVWVALRQRTARY